MISSTPLATVALGSDHAGFPIKEVIRLHLERAGHQVRDFGTFSEATVDYPEFVIPAAAAVAAGECDLGVVFGGSGNGEAIAANKVLGIRCAVCWEPELGRLARMHNNANVISLPGRFVTPDMARLIVDAWLTATFEAGRHVPRLAAVAAYETTRQIPQS